MVLYVGLQPDSLSFIMLPSNFDTSEGYKVSKKGIKSVGIVFVAVGCSLTVLLSFAIPSHSFKLDTIYLPAFTSCLIGLFTTIYSFIVQTQYTWNLSAQLVVAFSALGTVVYGALVIFSQRRVSASKYGRSRQTSLVPINQESAHPGYEPSIRSQQDPVHPPARDNEPLEQSFYSNYIANEFPTMNRSAPTKRSPEREQTAPSANFDNQSMVSYEVPPSAPPLPLSYDERTRLQLEQLYKRSNAGQDEHSASTGHRHEAGYRIEWQGSDDPTTPVHGSRGNRRSGDIVEQRRELPASPHASAASPFNDRTFGELGSGTLPANIPSQGSRHLRDL